MMKILIILSSVLFLSACFDSGDTQEKEVNKVQLGKTTFDKHCLVCHGKAGGGIVKDWRKRQADGNFPAPPMDGTAHTWHHSPTQLLRTINDGGVQFGGQMLGFKNQLSEAEKQALLDYIYSLWSKDIQQKYDARFQND